MKFHFSIIIIAAIVLSSCIKELEISNSGYKGKIVLWSILNIDSSIKATIAVNKGVKPSDTLSGIIANILLYKEENLIKKLNSVNISSIPQTFDFNINALPNSTYKIEIVSPEFNILANTQTYIKTKEPTIELSKGESAQLKYSIEDNLNNFDAYRFDLKIYNYGILYDSLFDKVIDSNYLYIKKFDKFDEPSLNYNLITSYQNGQQNYTFPVNDVLFNGKLKTFIFFIANSVSSNIFIPSGKTKNDNIIRNILVCNKRFAVINCIKISEDYYKFFSTENKNNAIFGTSYYNPINLFSNVQGGLGLMASQYHRTDTIWVIK
ncbi:MAG: DUF4249 family protein [Bacteroidia bacterium]|nr:DUF4249 family protein [Bacteroidia bacterium]